MEGGVAEGQGVEGSGGDSAGFCWILPVEVGDGFQGEDVRVFNPLVVRSVIPFKADKVVERLPTDLSIEDFTDFPFQRVSGETVRLTISLKCNI